MSSKGKEAVEVEETQQLEGEICQRAINDTEGADNERQKMRKRGRRGKVNKEVREEKTINELLSWTKKLNQDERVKKKKKEDEEKARKKLTREMEEPWGDEITKDHKWPTVKKEGRIRIYAQNVNGVSLDGRLMEWELTLEHLNKQQADIGCISEMNMDVTKTNVTHMLYEKTTKLDKYSTTIHAGSKTSMSTLDYKRGGLTTLVRGNWTGRIKEKGKEKLGRWTYVDLRGKDGKIVKIISTYRVCDQKKSQGKCTIYLQQQTDLMRDNRSFTEPREALLIDLAKLIQKEHKKGVIIILTGDFNEDIKNGKRINKFLQDVEMYNVMEARHSDDYPITYDRGKNCLDLIAISNTVPKKWILKCGYLPFYKGIMSDHRGMFVDLSVGELFDYVREDTNKDIYWRFKTTQVPKCKKYVETLENLLREAKIVEKIEDLEEDMCDCMEKEGKIDGDLVDECKKLFNKTTQLMIASERKTGRSHYKQGYPASRQLKKAADDYFDAKSELRRATTYRFGAIVPKIVAEKQKQVKKKKHELKCKQKQAIKLREDDLLMLAEKKAGEWNIKASKAILVIRDAEKSKRVHKKQRYFLNPQQKGGIRQLLVPAPKTNITSKESNITDPDTQYEVEDQNQMFDILLRQNFRHLLKSSKSLFTQGELIEKIGVHAENEFVDLLLNGTAKYEDILRRHEKYGDSLKRFLEQIIRPVGKEGKPIGEFQWQFGVEEYRATFSKTGENISCGPSGLHMSHWKAALESEMLMKVHSFFIQSAFRYGFTYKRWEVSWHCMIQKKEQPYVQKLRIIQLFKGDMNGGLKFLLGRMLMKHINNERIIDSEIFGSRPGKTGAEALLGLQLLNDSFQRCGRLLRQDTSYIGSNSNAEDWMS